MAKLNIKFSSGDSYSYDTKTAKEKPTSIQKEMQSSDPRGAAPSTSKKTFWYNDQNTPNFDPATAGDAVESRTKTKTVAAGAGRGGGRTITREIQVPTLAGRINAMTTGALENSAGGMLSAAGTVVSGLSALNGGQNRTVRNLGQGLDRAADAVNEDAAKQTAFAKNDTNAAGRFLVDVGTAGTQMLADAGTAALTGGSALVPMFLRSFGGGAQEARQTGKGVGTQLVYGLGEGAIQVGTEKISNVGSAFNKTFGKGVTDDVLKGFINKAASSATGRAFLTAGASAAGEGFEEFVGDLLEPFLKRATDVDSTARFNLGAAAYDAAVGTALGGVGAATDISAGIRQGRVDRAESAINSAYDAMRQDGMFSQEGRDAAQFAQNRFIAAPLKSTPHDRMTQMFIDTLAGKNATQEATGAAQGGQAGDLTSTVQTAPTEVVQSAVNPNGLTALSDQEQINLSSGKKNKIVSSFNDAVSFVRNALQNKQNIDRAYLGKVPDSVAQKVLSDTGADISGYSVVLPSDAVRHMFKNHGDPIVESARGQVSLAPETAANLTSVLSSPDKVTFSNQTDAFGRPTLMFEKQIGDYYVTAQAVTDGTKSLTTDTMYIRKKVSPATVDETQASSNQTSETGNRSTLSMNSISPSSANIKSDFLLDLVTGKKRVDQGKLTDAQFETAADHGLNIDADGKVYRPLPTDHIDRRTVESAGNRDVNAFQFDHPELHEYYKKAAESLMADADISTQFPMPRRTERTVNGKRTIQSAIDSVSLRSAMDMGLSRNQIIDAAQSLIDDHGQENYAAAKRLELVLDEMLTNGYTTVFGDAVEPNSAYIKAKTDIVGSSPAKSGEELPIWDMPEADNGRIDSLGSARGGFDPYSRLQNQTDAANFHDDGANAARVVDVPKTNFEGRNVPESAKTVMGAQAIDDYDVRMIERQIANGALAFDTITDEKAVAKAQNTIREKNFDGALEQYRATVENNIASKDNTTLGQQLLLQAMHDGNTANVSELLSLYTRNSTTAAQAMQAQAIFRRLSPEGQLLSIQKAVDSFNQKHDTGIEIDPEDMDAFVNATDDAARGEAAEAIFKHVAEQAPGTFKAKYDAIRYLAMLGNPRTHIRNILGNTLFQVPVTAKNRVGGVADAIASAVSGGKYERTKSITGVSPVSRLAKECRADWANAKDFISHGSKYSEGNATAGGIEAQQKAFGDKGAGKVVNKASEVNSALLEAEDTFAKKFIYTQSLAGYLKANGVKSVSEADAGLLNRARSYAAQEALRNTFNDTNSLSEAVSKLNGLRDNKNPVIKAAGYGVEGVLPFKKTPANILMRGAEYSPVGAIMGIIDTIRGARHGDAAKLTQGLDRIASGLTGSALMAAGMLAAGAGYVTGGDDEDDKQQNFKELTGHQNYALELKSGKSITLDWTAPAAIPFFMGVQLQHGMENAGLSLEDVSTAIKGMTDPMLEMTMLQGLNDVLDSAAYAKQRGGSVGGSIAAAALTNYVTQVFPTVFGQMERAGDKVRETTYIDKNSNISADTQYLQGRIANKIPGVDYHQIPYIDAWGREEDQGDTAKRIFNNVFNPAYVSDVKVRPVEQELQRLSDKTGETNVFPQRADKSITYSVAKGDDTVSKQKDLSANEYVKYAKALGQEKYRLLNSAVGSGYYKAMSDAEKADYVGKLYQYASAQAKGAVASGVVNDAWIDNARTAQKDIGVSTPEYIALHEKYGSALVGSSYEKVKTAVKSGISIEDYMGIRGTMDGNENGSISQAEARAALDASGLSKAQKDAVWKSINSSWKKNPYQ